MKLRFGGNNFRLPLFKFHEKTLSESRALPSRLKLHPQRTSDSSTRDKASSGSVTITMGSTLLGGHLQLLRLTQF